MRLRQYPEISRDLLRNSVHINEFNAREKKPKKREEMIREKNKKQTINQNQKEADESKRKQINNESNKDRFYNVLM